MAQAHEILHHRAGAHAVGPRLLAHERAGRGVQAHDRREHAKLPPARSQLIVMHAQHMPADIMAPPAIANVGGSGGEIRLKGQRIPSDVRIARKADRIAVAAWPAITGKGHSRLILPQGVKIARMVEGEQRIHARLGGAALLLPVNPPEIHALAPEILQHHLLKGLLKTRTCRIIGNGRFALRIHAHDLRHGGIQRFAGAHAVGRMIVQRHSQAMRVQPGQHALRIGKACLIPGIARPGRAVFGIDARRVPVHIQYRHGQRHPLFGKALHQLHVALLRIGIEAAPPVAQRIARQHGRVAGHLIIIAQAGAVIMAIAE